jgi:hypothetical protein
MSGLHLTGLSIAAVVAVIAMLFARDAAVAQAGLAFAGMMVTGLLGHAQGAKTAAKRLEEAAKPRAPETKGVSGE